MRGSRSVTDCSRTSFRDFLCAHDVLTQALTTEGLANREKPVPQLIAILVAFIAVASPAMACDAVCLALKKAAESAPYSGSATKSDTPQVCLTLAPNDPEAEIVLAVHYNGKPVFSTRWRKGAALATGGSERVPMICFDKERLNGATAIMLCNADVTVFIRTEDKLNLLRTKGRNPPNTPVCMKGAAACGGS